MRVERIFKSLISGRDDVRHVAQKTRGWKRVAVVVAMKQAVDHLLHPRPVQDLQLAGLDLSTLLAMQIEVQRSMNTNWQGEQ